DAGVRERRVLQDGGNDLTCARDRELHHDAPAEAGEPRQLLLVAVPDLVDVAVDDAADDLLVELSVDDHLTGDDLRGLRALAAVAGLADRAEVAGADRVLAGAPAARSGADDAEAAHAVGLTDLVAADQVAEHVLR